MNARGVDVSRFNRTVPRRLIVQCDFVIVKSSESDFTDPYYDVNSAAVLKAGKVLGAYHWVNYGPGPTRQARTMLAKAGNAAFLCLDHESHSALEHPSVTRAIIANLHKLDPQRRKVLLYASESHWPGDLGQDGNWVAHWGATPRLPWLFHQTTGGPLDHDQYNGDVAHLQAWAKTRRT